MPPPPPQVTQWLRETYPQPTVDPEWLEACYTWILSELHLDPARDMPAILDNVNSQLLGSDFADSMVAGTGFPQNVLGADHAVLRGPILVEVTEIMEIAHSAYSLLQVHESRQEYRKQAALRDASGDGREHERERKPMPKYPRSTLQLLLSDGALVLPAIEVKNLPQFELGETPLGYKMVIRDVTIRRGTAHLEPRCIDCKGHQTADRDERREAIFLRGLKLRLGEEAPEDEPAPAEPQRDPEPAHAPAPQPPPPAPPAVARVPAPVPAPGPVQRHLTPPPPRHSSTPSSRSPLRDITPPPLPAAGPSNAALLNLLEHADDAAEPRRRARKRPSRTGRSPSPEPPPRAELLQRSRFFGSQSPHVARAKRKETVTETDERSADGARNVEEAGEATVTLTGPGSRDAMKEFARTIGLSPPRAPAIEIPDSDGEDEEDAFARAPPPTSSRAGEARPLDVARAKARRGPQSDDHKEKKEKKELVLGDPSSDDYGFDFEMGDGFLESVTRAEEEGMKRTAPGNETAASTNGSSTVMQTQTQARVGTQTQVHMYSQSTGATLFSFGKGGATAAPTATTTTVAGTASRKNTPTVGTNTSSSGSRATSAPRTSSSSQSNPKRNTGVAVANEDVINISDEEPDKENKAVPTRHVRRRVVRPAATDVIELSD